MKTFVLAAALALAAPVLPAAAQMMDQPPAPATVAPGYLFRAGEGDVFEITSSQIALQRSQNPALRRYAQMLIDHHSRTTNLALATAKQAGVAPPPPILQAPKRDMISQLLAAPAGDFDRTYLDQQVQSHQEARALHQGYAASGDVPALRRTAAATVPIVQRHLDEVTRMRGSM